VAHQRVVLFLLDLPKREVLSYDICRQQIGKAIIADT